MLIKVQKGPGNLVNSGFLRNSVTFLNNVEYNADLRWCRGIDK